MPIKKAALKALGQSKKKEQRNKKVKRNLSYQERRFNKAINANDLNKTQEIYQILQKALDKAAEKKIIKKNNAARKKSRLFKKMKQSKK